MKPKNEKEINNAFFQFLLLFLLTIAFVVVAIFFDYGFPWKDYSTLRQQYTETSSLLRNKTDLINRIDTLRNRVLIYENNPSINEDYIANGINELQTANTDSISLKLNKAIARSLDFLLKTKLKTIELQKSLNEETVKNGALTTERDQLKKDFDQCQKDYNQLLILRK